MSGRKHDTISAIAQAVAEALVSARDNAVSQAKDWGHDASEHLDDARTEAGRRAGLAWDALAGRSRSNEVWPAVGMGLLGIAVGWIACDIYRRRQQIADTVSEGLEDIEERAERRFTNAQATLIDPMD